MNRGELGDLTVGVGEDGKDVKIAAEHRSRGVLMVGQPGSGKSTLEAHCALQDASSDAGGVILEPHSMAGDVIARLPRHLWDSPVIISTLIDETPLWSPLDIARNRDERLVVASQLADAWRAQWGDQSVGVRAKSILEHAVLTLPHDFPITALELRSVLAIKNYRESMLMQRKKEAEQGKAPNMAFSLELFWNHIIGPVEKKGTLIEWSQAIDNKLSPLLNHPWLRRATTGVPVAAGGRQMSVAELYKEVDQNNVEQVYFIRDGQMIVRLRSIDKYSVVHFTHELDDHLIDNIVGSTVTTRFTPGGIEINTQGLRCTDLDDPSLSKPTEREILQYGINVAQDVARRRRRRSQRRFADLYLRPRNVTVRETIDIGDMLADGRMVIVQVPERYGPEVTQTAATMVLLSTLLHGLRQLALPAHRRVPCWVYIDEAELFAASGIERMLAELRKADVGIFLAVQRLGQFDPSLRKGILDTVGEFISLAAGLEEGREIARIMRRTGEIEADHDEVRALKRFEGLLSPLGPDMERAKTQKFSFKPLDALTEDGTVHIRQRVRDAHYQLPDAADSTFSRRAENIRNTLDGTGPDVTGRSVGRTGRPTQPYAGGAGDDD